MSEQRGCPKCKKFSPVSGWDSTTIDVGKIKNVDNYISAGVDDDKMSEQEPWFHCPVCGEEVDGLDLLRKEVK